CGNPIAGGQCDKLIASTNKECVRVYEERTGLLLNEGCEGALDVTRAASRHELTEAVRGRAIQKTNHRCRRLLWVHYKWPRRSRATDKRDEFAPTCTEQTSPRACTVKAPHIASLTTKAYFRKCQIRCRLTESQPNELASPHSITSSALARSDGGTVSPRALAAVESRSSETCIGYLSRRQENCILKLIPTGVARPHITWR